MNKQQLLEITNRSERVRLLLASTIAVGIRRCYGVEITDSDARGLARSHDLRGAIELFRKKAEIHKEIRNERTRTKLVILETILDSPVDTTVRGTISEQVIKSRKRALKLDSESDREAKRKQTDQLMLLQLKSDIEEWGSQYRSFLRQLGRLYDLRKRELLALRLNPGQLQSALAELEIIIGSALQASASAEVGRPRVA